MRVLILFCCCFFTSILVFSQSGYIGKKNLIELKTGLVPSYKHAHTVKDDLAYERLKLVNASYRLSYSRVIAKNFEISVGYEYASIRCITDHSIFNDVDTFASGNSYTTIEYKKVFLNDPQMIYHGGHFSFNFYRLGSLAPVGKFIGLSIAYGISSLESGQEIMVGKRGILEKDGFFRSYGPIADSEQILIPVDRTIKSIHFKARIGRNYPVTDQLMITCGMTFPIISRYTSGTTSYLGPGLEEGYAQSENSVWTKFPMTAVRLYNRIMVEAGLRFHF